MLSDLLIEAVRASDFEECKALLDRGADVNASGDVWDSSLHAAVTMGDEPISRLLIERGGDIGIRTGNLRRPLLVTAAMYENIEVCELLIAHGCGLDDVDKEGRCALFEAARNGRPDMVRLLIDSGASLKPNATNGSTALHWAVTSNDVATCKEIMNHGLGPSMVLGGAAPDYLTPLQQAISENADKVLAFFVEECGEAWSDATYDGRTVWDLAWNAPRSRAYLRALETGQSIEDSIGHESAGGISLSRSGPSNML
jgi:ankyrin repeat protein